MGYTPVQQPPRLELRSIERYPRASRYSNRPSLAPPGLVVRTNFPACWVVTPVLPTHSYAQHAQRKQPKGARRDATHTHRSLGRLPDVVQVSVRASACPDHSARRVSTQEEQRPSVGNHLVLPTTAPASLAVARDDGPSFDRHGRQPGATSGGQKTNTHPLTARLVCACMLQVT